MLCALGVEGAVSILRSHTRVKAPWGMTVCRCMQQVFLGGELVPHLWEEWTKANDPRQTLWFPHCGISIATRWLKPTVTEYTIQWTFSLWVASINFYNAVIVSTTYTILQIKPLLWMCCVLNLLNLSHQIKPFPNDPNQAKIVTISSSLSSGTFYGNRDRLI